MKKLPNEVGVLITITIMLFAGFIYPLTLTLGNQELANPEISFRLFLFSLILIIGAVGALLVYFTRYFWKGDNTYGDSFGLYNIGKEPALKIFEKFSPFQLGLLMLIIFSALFLGANVLRNSGLITTDGFTSTIVLPQQFSKTDSLLFSTFLVPIAEEAMNVFVLGVLSMTLVILALKNKIQVKDFKTFYFVLIPIISGALAVVWHINAYPGSDTAAIVVFMFWAVKNLLILGTGFVFTGIFMHMANNFFIEFPQLFASDIYLVGAIGFIVGLAVLYFYLYKGRLWGGKKRETLLS